jgi:hypothetical protein
MASLLLFFEVCRGDTALISHRVAVPSMESSLHLNFAPVEELGVELDHSTSFTVEINPGAVMRLH